MESVFQPEPPIRLTAKSAEPILSILKHALVCSAAFAYSAVKNPNGLALGNAALESKLLLGQPVILNVPPIFIEYFGGH
jgi:hypothetical protein